MDNKILYGLLTALIISACNSDKQTADNQLSGTVNLIGTWTIASTISRTDDSEGESNCNVCPEITFNNNNAVLTHPDNRTENYGWTIIADTLSLQSKTSPTISTLPYFFSIKYKIEFKQSNDIIELTLSPDKNFTYVLRR